MPIYNAIVYVPNEPVAPLTDGAVTCDRCDAKVSGNPVVIAHTDTSGQFTLANVPATDNLPLVVQIGKWRRQLVVPHVEACATAALDGAQTRLPRNRTEGDMPRVAIATGGADPFECLLLKVGIDPAEITAPAGGGRVSYYRTLHSGTGNNPRPWLWTAKWAVPDDAPVGVVKYTVTGTDKEGRTGEFKPFEVEPSQLTVVQ